MASRTVLRLAALPLLLSSALEAYRERCRFMGMNSECSPLQWDPQSHLLQTASSSLGKITVRAEDTLPPPQDDQQSATQPRFDDVPSDATAETLFDKRPIANVSFSASLLAATARAAQGANVRFKLWLSSRSCAATQRACATVSEASKPVICLVLIVVACSVLIFGPDVVCCFGRRSDYIELDTSSRRTLDLNDTHEAWLLRLPRQDELVNHADTFMHLDLFKGVHAVALEEVRKIFMLRRIPAGRDIFKLGDEGDTMFILLQGRVGIMGHQGKLATLTGGLKGTVFGEMAMLQRKPRMAAAVAETTVVLYSLSINRFEAVQHHIPNIRYRLETLSYERAHANR